MGGKKVSQCLFVDCKSTATHTYTRTKLHPCFGNQDYTTVVCTSLRKMGILLITEAIQLHRDGNISYGKPLPKVVSYDKRAKHFPDVFKEACAQSKQANERRQVYRKQDHSLGNSRLYNRTGWAELHSTQGHFRAESLPWEPHIAGKCTVAGQDPLVGQCCCPPLLFQSSAQSDQMPSDRFLGSHGSAGTQFYPDLQPGKHHFLDLEHEAWAISPSSVRERRLFEWSCWYKLSEDYWYTILDSTMILKAEAPKAMLPLATGTPPPLHATITPDLGVWGREYRIEILIINNVCQAFNMGNKPNAIQRSLYSAYWK